MRKCEAEGCEAQVRSDLLMCARHWRMVPLLLKAAVNSTWSNRQHAAGGPYYREAVEAHEAAKRDARAAVAGHAP